MSNLGLDEGSLEEIGQGARAHPGGRSLRRGGDAQRSGYNLGGEQSGHIVFLEHNTTGDGLITALQTLAILRRKERKLSELTAGFQRFPQSLVNVAVAEKPPIESIPELHDAVRRVEAELGKRGRVLVRYSGTEPKARVMVEGEDEAEVSRLAAELAERFQRCLGGT